MVTITGALPGDAAAAAAEDGRSSAVLFVSRGNRKTILFERRSTLALHFLPSDTDSDDAGNVAKADFPNKSK